MKEDIEFYDLYHLGEAWTQVKRKKAQGGIDGVSIEEFDKRADKHLHELSQLLQQDKYVPEPYQRIYVRRHGSKTRPLGLPTVRDKIVQMAVRNAIEPVFNAVFANCSYAYRPGKGHRKAIRRVEHYLGIGNIWVTTCDIDNFFDSLDHNILLRQIKEKINDNRILRLITLWLRIGIVYKEEYKATDKGVPQGGIVSPLLSNIYLHPFDQKMVQKRFNLVRYSDDFIILQRNPRKAELAHDEAKQYLASELKLRLNPIEQKTWHVKSGFVFLGIQFRGYRKTIAEHKFQKACSKIQHICRKGDKLPLGDVIAELNESIKSWRYYYGAGDTAKQFLDLETLMQSELSSIVIGKLAKRELESQSQAERILQQLDFLTAKKFPERIRLIKAIIKGQVSTAARTVKGREHEDKNEKDDPELKTVRSSADRQEKVTKEQDVRRQIAGKKKKYRRRQAQSSELIVTTRYCQIGKMYQRIVVRKQGRILQQIPHMKLKHIMVMSDKVSLSSDVIRLCGKVKIPIDFTDLQGRPIARLSHPEFPRSRVGLAQLEAFNNGKSRILAKTFVSAKVRNQLNLIKYFHKYRKDVDQDFDRKFAEEEERIEGYLKELNELKGDWSLDEHRGKLFAVEGRAASSYWALIRDLVEDDVPFKSRQHQGATDLFNCLLNYGYGFLYARIWGSVLRAGLNPMISYLHTDQPNKPSLIFDLIEEFRPQGVDRVIVSMIGRSESLTMGGKFLDDVTRRKVARNILERLNIPTRFRNREKSLVEIMDHQAKALAKFLQGQEKRYWPFIGKW